MDEASNSRAPTFLHLGPVDPLYLQYIARQLANGTYSSLTAIKGPRYSREDTRQLQKPVRDLLQDHRDALPRYFLRNPPIVSPGDLEMMRVLDNLKSHTRPDYNRLAPSATFDRLPSFVPQTKALMADPPFQPFGHDDALALALVKWFKGSFMRWIDPITCPDCKGPTTSIGGDDPSEKEKLDGAGRVELHGCVDPVCGGVRRFCRYNKTSTLFRTREGRCGEWAHLFHRIMRQMGLQVRYVWNSEDHVWAEYWSSSLRHWVHVDPCEGVTNKPLLYARGWGKKQAFCIAAGESGYEDVTRYYVDDWHTGCQLRRLQRGWSEKNLKLALMKMTIETRITQRVDDILKHEAMDKTHAAWASDESGRLAEAEMEDLGGRVSGPADWRAKRFELGIQQNPKPVYKHVRDLHSSTEKLSVFGNAKLVDNSVLLTLCSGQTSSVFLPTAISQKTSFRCEVTFKLASPPGAGEADGIAVVFSPERRLGLGGYGLGYSGLGGKGDFAVEIDTYRTQDHADDPPTPHISLHSPPDAHHRNSLACTPAGSIPYLSDGREYTLELLYHGGQRSVSAYLSLPPENGQEIIELPLWSTVVPDGEGKDWYMGVTGSCGGLWQRQEILEWAVEEVDFETQPSSTATPDTEGTDL